MAGRPRRRMRRNALQAVPVYTGLHQKDAEPIFDAFLFMPTFQGGVALLPTDEFDRLSSPENLHIYQAFAQDIRLTNQRTKTSWTAALGGEPFMSTDNGRGWSYCQAMFGATGLIFFVTEDRAMLTMVTAMKSWQAAHPKGNLYLQARDGIRAAFPDFYGRILDEDDGW